MAHCGSGNDACACAPASRMTEIYPDRDEGHEPKRVGVTIKLFYTTSVAGVVTSFIKQNHAYAQFYTSENGWNTCTLRTTAGQGENGRL